jgi:ketosteroid isomerase-like protein
MASSNLDLVRSIYADWERGDFSRADWADPEIEYVIADGPSPSSRRGIAAMGAAWRDVLSPWRDYRAVGEVYRELADGRMLTLTAFSARGRTSNIEVRQVLARGASVMQIYDGKVTKLVVYFNRDRALADLGLEEQGTAEESTTPDPEDLLRRLIEAFNRRDLDAVLGYLAPDVVYDTSHSGFGIYTGVPAVRGFFEDWVSSYEEFEVVAEEMVDLGNGVGYAILCQRGRPVGSSGEVRRRFASVGLSVNGLWVRFTTYTDIDEARAAAERLAQERG